VPALELVFEYQGNQHYQTHPMWGDSTVRKERDNERYIACEGLGLTYIAVPYWWRNDKESIITLLHEKRPDLILPIMHS